MSASKRLFIIYGFAEGPKLAKHLKQEFAKIGIEVVTSMRDSNIILSHSGGCFLLPHSAEGKRIIIANPVCGSLWRLPVVIAKKVWWDFKDHIKDGRVMAWLKKSCWNLLYIFVRMDRSLRMMWLAPRYQNRLPHLKAKSVTVLNNRHDPWAKLIPKDQVLEHSYVFITRPGPHDDIWANPASYLDILQ